MTIAKMEQFIDLVRQLPCLWDMNCREYRDMRKKHIAWKKIVQELKSKQITDIRTAKAEWKKLRDNHRDSLKRLKAIKQLNNSSESCIINKWKYAEHMQFLLPYMKTRRRKLSASSEDNDDFSPSDSITAASASNADITFSSESHSLSNIDTTEDVEHKFKRRETNNEFGEIMIDMDDRNRYLERSRHPLDSFFESMCETSKQFPTWLQHSVKRKIFTVISEAEDTFESYKTRESIF